MTGIKRLNRAAALALAIAGGLWAGQALTSASQAPETRVVRAGPATLEVPNGWRNIAVKFGPAADRSLVPAPLRRLAGDGPRPATLAGHAAWRYHAARGREITVLPTSDGMLAVACRGDCAASIAAVSLPGAEILVPSEDLAFQLKLPDTLQALDRARVDGRTALARARTDRGQARVAGRLAREHHAAADSLRPLAGSSALPDALETVADAYGDLQNAAIAGSSSRFRAARASVGAAESRLARAVPATALRRAPAPTIEPAPANTSRAIGVIALLLGLIALGLAITRRRRPPTPPAAVHDSVPPPSGWLAVDPVGRWDARS